MNETFNQSQIIFALEEFLRYGEETFHPDKPKVGHPGYFSGNGWPARVLRYHLTQLTEQQERTSAERSDQADSSSPTVSKEIMEF